MLSIELETGSDDAECRAAVALILLDIACDIQRGRELHYGRLLPIKDKAGRYAGQMKYTKQFATEEADVANDAATG